MIDWKRYKTPGLIGAGVLAGLAIAAIAIALLGRGTVVEPPDTTDETTATADATASVDATAPAETDPIAEESPGEAPPATSDGSWALENEPAVTERQPGVITNVRPASGTYYLSIDYVQFLTGGIAADAAAARGDESPPPNDYYIINDNPLIREFPIQPGISVRVATNDDGTSNPPGRTMTLAAWTAAMSGPQRDAFRAGVYWITLTDGTVTAIEQQYLP